MGGKYIFYVENFAFRLFFTTFDLKRSKIGGISEIK